MASVLLGCLATVGAYYCRERLRRRFAQMEDTLRVYNTVNVAIGRHITTLENELQELRKSTPVSATSPSARATMKRVVRPVTAHAEFSDAELRLAQRLKSHLGSMRLS